MASNERLRRGEVRVSARLALKGQAWTRNSLHFNPGILKYPARLRTYVSQQVVDVDTVFLHETGDEFLVVVRRAGKRVLQGRLSLKQTPAGPRPGRFRIKDGDDEIPRQPDQFIELVRRASRIRISEQTSPDGRIDIETMLDGYQLEASQVRTCRYCAGNGRYSPLTSDSAIKADDEYICASCAMRELEREANYRGLHAGARNRLEELLLDVGNLDRIANLLSGRLDPELTKFDEISATVDVVDPVPITELALHPVLAESMSGFDKLLPVQSLAVRNGLLEGTDQLVVSATATGKTLVGELAGINRALNGSGKLLFLVPLVALANQKYQDFQNTYGADLDVTLRVGASRIRDSGQRFDPSADVIVGTYEGIDHALRTNRDLGQIGTVVIDEVHTLGEEDRGHRLDGLISRLKFFCNQSGSDTQWVYLSATVGNPSQLAHKLEATLIEFEERPVPIERHVTFADGHEKIDIENRLVKRAFDSKSSKGYRGQTIIFTNSRRRCHEIARRMDYEAAPYHAGLDYTQRKRVESEFADQNLAAVVTTAALAAGVDFPASQVVFDSLAMGIEWLSVQEFEQMLGRAGRPDYHDMGTVYVLVEPDGSYHHSMERTEDEVAFTLLKGNMEDVTTTYDESAAIEETLANIVVGGKQAKSLNDQMIGDIPTTHAVGKLLEYNFIDGLSPTTLGRAVTEHFLTPDAAFMLLDGIRKQHSPGQLVAAIELKEDD